MKVKHLNWSSQLQDVETLLDGAGGVLHVRGGEECMPNVFVEVIRSRAEEPPRSMRAAVIDPNNQLTASPLAAFREILRVIGGIQPLNPPAQKVTLSVASDVRSFFGGVSIDNVTVNMGVTNESEELATLIAVLSAEIAAGRRFDALVVLFQNCHEMDYSLRKVFHFSLWSPVLQQLVELGAKMIFQYEPHKMQSDLVSLPPNPAPSVTLPTELNDVTDQLAQIALSENWEANDNDAQVLARGVLDISSSARRVYEAMAMLAMRQRDLAQ